MASVGIGDPRTYGHPFSGQDYGCHGGIYIPRGEALVVHQAPIEAKPLGFHGEVPDHAYRSLGNEVHAAPNHVEKLSGVLVGDQVHRDTWQPFGHSRYQAVD
jgi:hypothetical protein